MVVCKNALVGCALLAVSLNGCTALNMNPYQDGRPLGKDRLLEDVGLGLGQSYDFEVDTLAARTYEIETSHGQLIPLAFVQFTVGATSRFDAGAAVHTTLGASGGKVFGKYSVVDSDARIGLALLPSVAVGGQWATEGDTEDDVEGNLSATYFASEIAAVMSYHPSPKTALTLSPRYSIQKIGLESKRSGDTLHHKGGSWYFSPGFSAGIHVRPFRFETTLMYFDRSTWVPHFGLSLIVEDKSFGKSGSPDLD